MNFSCSCVIPVFNGAAYIAEALESLLTQSSPLQEIIVVDDGSTDDTRAVVEMFGRKVLYLEQKKTGVSSARNRGIRVSKSKFVCFLDADDYYHQHKHSKQLECFESNPALDLCVAGSTYFWSPDLEDCKADPRFQHDFWRKVLPGHISSWLVRKTVFEYVGYFDESLKYSEDTDWLLRFKDSGRTIHTLPQCLSYRRLHRVNVTAQNRKEQVRGLVEAIRRSRGRRIKDAK